MDAVYLYFLSLFAAVGILPDDLNFRGNTPWARYLVTGSKALDNGDYRQAVPAFEQALRSIPQVSRADLLERAFAANELGLAHSHLGRYSQAEVQYRCALAIWRDVLGPDTAMVAVALNNIGVARFHTGQLVDARRYHLEALTIDENVHGPSSAAVANDMNNLAVVYAEERKFSRAEQLFRRAIDIGRSLAHHEARVPQFMRNLAALFVHLRRFERAKALQEQVLETQETEYGSTHPEVGITLSELAYSEVGLKKCSAAIQYAQESVEILKARLGEEHSRTATAYLTLGLAYECEKRNDLAEPALRRVIEIEQHTEVRADVRSLHLRDYARVLRARHKKTEAKRFEAMAAEIEAAGRREGQSRHIVDVKELELKR